MGGLQEPHLGERVELRAGVGVRFEIESLAQWKLPGKRPQTYAVFVDDRDLVWLSDLCDGCDPH